MRASENPLPHCSTVKEEIEVKEKAPVVKELYRLSVEPRVVDQLAKLATRTGEPRSRLATRLFTDAVMAARPPSRPPKSNRSEANARR